MPSYAAYLESPQYLPSWTYKQNTDKISPLVWSFSVLSGLKQFFSHAGSPVLTDDLDAIGWSSFICTVPFPPARVTCTSKQEQKSAFWHMRHLIQTGPNHKTQVKIQGLLQPSRLNCKKIQFFPALCLSDGNFGISAQHQLRHKSPGRTQHLSLDVPLAPTDIYLFRNREVWLHTGILLRQNQTHFLCHSHSLIFKRGEQLCFQSQLWVCWNIAVSGRGGLVNTTHYRKKAAHHWSPWCHWSASKCGSGGFDLNTWAKYTVNWSFHTRNICKQMATASGAFSSPSSGLDFACHCP